MLGLENLNLTIEKADIMHIHIHDCSKTFTCLKRKITIEQVVINTVKTLVKKFNNEQDSNYVSLDDYMTTFILFRFYVDNNNIYPIFRRS